MALFVSPFNTQHMANITPSPVQQAELNQKLDPVVKELSDMLGVPNVLHPGRKRPVIQAREFFFRYATTRYELTRHQLGWYTGKDHSSVTHALRSFENLSSTDKSYRAHYASIATRLDGILNNNPDESLRDFLARYARSATLTQVERIFMHIMDTTIKVTDMIARPEDETIKQLNK